MKEIKKEATKIIAVSAVHQFGLSLLFAVYTVYLLSRGLSLFEASLVNMSYHIAVPLLEIPTGAISDTWGRKKALLLSTVIWMVGSAVYGLSSHFVWFVVAEITVAIATAFGSGCFSAHIWDVVSDHGSSEGIPKREVESLNGKIVANHRVVLGIVSAIGGLIGAWLFAINPSLPWFGSVVMYLVAFIATKKFISEPTVRTTTGRFRERLSLALVVSKESLLVGINTRSLRRMAIINLLGGLAAAPLFMFWQPRLLEMSSIATLGFAWVFIQAAVTAGKYLGGLLNGRAKSYRLVSASLFVAALMAFMAALAQEWIFLVVSFLAFEAALGLNAYAIEVKNQQDITSSGHGESTESNKRATLISFNSMAKGVGSSVGLLVGGLLSQVVSISVSWIFGSVTMFVLSIMTYSWIKKSD